MQNQIEKNAKELAAFFAEMKDYDEQEFIKSLFPSAKDIANNIDYKKVDGKVDNKVYISYEEITRHMNHAKLVIGNEYDTILCITRGGLIPAGMLAYQLDIKNVVNVKISSYNDNDEQEYVDVQSLSKKDLKILKRSNRVLVVDDIVDSGNTIEALDEYLYDELGKGFGELDIFSIVSKKSKLTKFSIYNMDDDDRWIVFPWDK